MGFECSHGLPVPVVYLPGAGGRSSFWQPVAERLRNLGDSVVVGYPGFGDTPREPRYGNLSDYYEGLLGELPERFSLVAQSMGNVLALRIAIEHPERVAKFVVCAATGGVDVHGLGGESWRESLMREQPSSPAWFIDDRSDFSDQLGRICASTLILSGDDDPLSPVSVGEFLKARIPFSRLEIVSGGTHWMAYEEPERIATLIGSFLSCDP